MTPKDREKRWVREKGSKNCARMWREDFGMWVICPMNPDKEMKYITPVWEPREVAFGKVKKIVFKSSEAQKKRHRSF